jgi:hypothetical protein
MEQRNLNICSQEREVMGKTTEDETKPYQLNQFIVISQKLNTSNYGKHLSLSTTFTLPTGNGISRDQTERDRP